MARIYKRSDRIKVKIDEVTVTIAPLSLDQKTEAQSLMALGKINRDYNLITKGIISLIKSAVKSIDGLENADGSKYQLTFNGDLLSDESIDDLFNIELHKKLVMVCSSLVVSIPTQFVDETGQPIEGVTLLDTAKAAVNTDPK